MERCHQPTPNYICTQCARYLHRDLRAVEWLTRQLQVTLTRRDQLGGPYSDGGHATEKPLVFNASASEAAFALRDTLGAWATEVAAHIGIEFTPVWATHPADLVGPLRPGERRMRRNYRPTSPDYAAFLVHYAAHIPQMPDAAMCADEIAYAVALATRTIDKRELAVFCGPCPHCDDGGLFGKRDAEHLHCRGCGARVAREDNDVSVSGEIQRRLFTAGDIAIIVESSTGLQITSKRVHNLAQRRHGRIRSVVDTTGRRLYSATDVLAALGHPRLVVAA